MKRELLTIIATAFYAVDATETVREDFGYYEMPVPEYRYSDQTLKVDIQYANQEEFDELMEELLDSYFGKDSYDHTEYEIISREEVKINTSAQDGFAMIL